MNRLTPTWGPLDPQVTTPPPELRRGGFFSPPTPKNRAFTLEVFFALGFVTAFGFRSVYRRVGGLELAFTDSAVRPASLACAMGVEVDPTECRKRGAVLSRWLGPRFRGGLYRRAWNAGRGPVAGGRTDKASGSRATDINTHKPAKRSFL